MTRVLISVLCARLLLNIRTVASIRNGERTQTIQLTELGFHSSVSPSAGGSATDSSIRETEENVSGKSEEQNKRMCPSKRTAVRRWNLCC